MKTSAGRVLYATLAILLFIFAIWVVYFTATNSSRLDFRVFYGAGFAATRGLNIYSLYGIYMMPFWYFPWVAWMFAPFSILTFSQAWYFYILLCCILLWIVLLYFSTVFKITRRWIDRIFIYSLALLLCMMLFNFGQTNIIVVALATLVIFLMEGKKYFLAGLVLPLALIKPHLLVIFVIACLVKGGKRTFLGAGISSLVMFGIETLAAPDWFPKFIHLFQYGARRNEQLYWGHTTLPRLFGLQENFVGTGNLPIIIALMVAGIFVVWKFREKPAAQVIALGLTASLLAAPRAFGYDLILLFPSMLFLSRNFNSRKAWLWIVAIAIPFVFNFSTNSYLLTLLVFLASVWKMQGTDELNYDQSPAIPKV